MCPTTVLSILAFHGVPYFIEDSRIIAVSKQMHNGLFEYHTIFSKWDLLVWLGVTN
jgi:hypothetical protein